jgi:hypothetical protein
LVAGKLPGDFDDGCGDFDDGSGDFDDGGDFGGADDEV